MVTMQQWNESKKHLSNFLNIGDEVDQDIVNFCLDTMPPITWRYNIIQIGEAYDNLGVNNSFRYLTIEKNDGKWFYTGPKVKGGK